MEPIPAFDLYDLSAIAPPAVQPPGDGSRIVRPIPFAQFRREIMTNLYSPPMRARATCAKMARALDVLDGLGVRSTSDLTIPLIARVTASLPSTLSRYTIRSVLSYISAACTYAQEADYIDLSPFARRRMRRWVRTTSVSPAHERYLTRDEIRSMFDLLQRDVSERLGWAQWRARRNQALFALISLGGLRRNEALYAQVQDLDIAGRVINIVDRSERALKTERSSQPVPMIDSLAMILTDWLQHRMDTPPGETRPPSPWLFPNLAKPTPWTGGKNGFKPLDRLQAVASRAGISDFTWHALRRSLATYLQSHGCGSALIARILRHSPQVSDRWYRKNELSEMRKAIDGFEY